MIQESNSAVLLREDHHVHSTFSDGKSTLEENVARCEALGLTHLGCVDHVREDSDYMPAYIAAVQAVRETTAVRLSIGVEAKILDHSGALDLPESGLDGIDRVYVADHQFPWTDGPRSPRVVREWIEQGKETASECVRILVEATINSVRGYTRHPAVLAHLFSILPKVGLSEDDVSDDLLQALAAGVAEAGAIVEISERWRCPSVRTLRAMRDANVPIICSTDSHSADSIGGYDYVRETLKMLDA